MHEPVEGLLESWEGCVGRSSAEKQPSVAMGTGDLLITCAIALCRESAISRSAAPNWASGIDNWARWVSVCVWDFFGGRIARDSAISVPDFFPLCRRSYVLCARTGLSCHRYGCLSPAGMAQEGCFTQAGPEDTFDLKYLASVPFDIN